MDTVDSNEASAKDADADADMDADADAEDSGDADEGLPTTPSLRLERRLQEILEGKANQTREQAREEEEAQKEAPAPQEEARREETPIEGVVAAPLAAEAPAAEGVPTLQQIGEGPEVQAPEIDERQRLTQKSLRLIPLPNEKRRSRWRAA